MAEKRTRRSFTREFKAQAVKRLLEGGKGLSEVATELGLSTGQLSTWRSEQLAAGSAEVLAQRKAEEAETQRLRRKVKRLEEENLDHGDDPRQTLIHLVSGEVWAGAQTRVDMMIAL